MHKALGARFSEIGHLESVHKLWWQSRISSVRQRVVHLIHRQREPQSPSSSRCLPWIRAFNDLNVPRAFDGLDLAGRRPQLPLPK